MKDFLGICFVYIWVIKVKNNLNIFKLLFIDILNFKY